MSLTEENKILVLMDYENIISNVFSIPPEKFPLPGGFRELKTWLEAIGKIFAVFVFTSPHKVGWEDIEEIFQEYGVFIVTCRPEISKERKINTTDDKMIELGKKMLKFPGLTHLCLVSGDADFEPLVERAKELGIKTAIAAGDLNSLSQRLIDLADRFSDTGKKMILIFSQTIDKK